VNEIEHGFVLNRTRDRFPRHIIIRTKSLLNQINLSGMDRHHEINVPRHTKDFEEAGALVAQAKAQINQAQARIKVARAQSEAAADIFAMLRSKDDVTVSRSALAEGVERLRDRARDLEARGRIVLGAHLARASGREILDEALRAFSGYHTTPVLEPRGANLVLADTRLIFYYQNRLASQGLAPDLLTPGGVAGATVSRRGVSIFPPERSAAS